MPVLDNERTTMPRSALRYRPSVNTAQSAAAPISSRVRRSRPDAQSTAARAAPDDLDEEEYEAPRRSAAPTPRRSIAQPVRARRRHPLFWLAFGLLLVILIWLGSSQLVIWGTNELNNIRYGTPRTFQTDTFVNQGDSAQHPSHFIALNLHGNIVIMEFIGGDPAKAHEFEVASGLGPDADQAVVTLRFVDVLHTGRPAMLVDVGGVQSILVNDQGTFRPPTALEQQQILQALQ